MKTQLNIFLFLFSVALCAQNNYKKTFSIRDKENLILKFDYPQLVKITTWDQPTIEISGKVNISDGAQNASFVLTENSDESGKIIEGKIENYSDLPQRIIAINGDEKIAFKSKEELNLYTKKHNVNFQTIQYSASVDIVLEIKVPKHIKTQIEAKYGTVEIDQFNGQIVAKSTYGSVDAKINEKEIGKINVENFYGKFYTNLTLPIETVKKDDFHTIITSSIGNGVLQEFSSKYGNVYLRK
ncbi:hypothetical protein [Empedobacter brevis]|uniref:hypothetical protein n=1 Tax=Empedobacter brevis TaxID=247 RepID=UPI0023EFFA50|nr:hypothetical protein [Empedobacter brevis]